MPVNFPANPSLNNTYTFSGRTWTWNGTYWDQTPNASQAEAINGIPVGNVTPATGAFTELSVTGNILTDSYRYANGDPFVSSNYGDSNVATYLGNIGGNVLPAANITYDLGSDTNRWRDIYLANSTIHLGSQQISADGSGLNLPSSVSIGNVTLDTSSGNLSLPAGSSIDGAAVATPRISSIDYPGDDPAADTAGGQDPGHRGLGFCVRCQCDLGWHITGHRDRGQQHQDRDHSSREKCWQLHPLCDQLRWRVPVYSYLVCNILACPPGARLLLAVWARYTKLPMSQPRSQPRPTAVSHTACCQVICQLVHHWTAVPVCCLAQPIS
jgi:hypothetical protein